MIHEFALINLCKRVLEDYRYVTIDFDIIKNMKT